METTSEQFRTIYFEDGSYLKYMLGNVKSPGRELELLSRIHLSLNPDFPWKDMVADLIRSKPYGKEGPNKWQQFQKKCDDEQEKKLKQEKLKIEEEEKRREEKTMINVEEGKSNTRKKNKNKKRQVQALKDATNCVVCKDARRQIVFMPCNHMCCCENCSQRVIDKCIVCNAVIQSKIKVYLP